MFALLDFLDELPVEHYNVLFAERDGTQAASQVKAFEDTWRGDEGAARAYEDIVED